MAENTSIQWCDHTFNPWSGCTKVNAGCAHCYAEVNYSVKMRGVKWGPNGNRVKASESMWKQPLKWNRQAGAKFSAWDAMLREGHMHSALVAHGFIAPTRPRVFCSSLADVFEDWKGEIRDHKGGIIHRCRAGHAHSLDAVYTHGAECHSGCNRAAHPLALDDLRRDLFALRRATPNLDWLYLTKRAENIRAMIERAGDGGYAENRWLGVSVSDQATADAAIPELLKLRDLAPVLFVSYEPAIGPVDFSPWLRCQGCGYTALDKAIQCDHHLCKWPTPCLDWLIVGGESGHRARPFDIEWARSARDQCRAAGVPLFLKQLGANIRASCIVDPIDQFPGCVRFTQGDKPEEARIFLKDSHGGDESEWPDDLKNCRAFPSVEPANHSREA